MGIIPTGNLSLEPRVLRTLPILTVLGCAQSVELEHHLQVLNLEPPGGAMDVAVDATIVATFAEPLVRESVGNSTAYVRIANDSGSTWVPVSSLVIYDEDAWSVLLKPQDALPFSWNVQVVLTTGLEGEQSGPLAAEVQAVFTTVGSGEVGSDAGDSEEGDTADTGSP